MKKGRMALLMFTALIFCVPQVLAAWKANTVVNETEENIYVIYSTWQGAGDNFPRGFRTRGYFRIAPREVRAFYAWDRNRIYFRISQSGAAIKPEASSETFSSYIHPSAAFTVVLEKIEGVSVAWGEVTYSAGEQQHERISRRNGFMAYSNGSCVRVTSAWVPVASSIDSPPAGMVLIPAGEFEMGSNDAEADHDEKPVHTVYVDAFYMDTHEVTNLDFKRFVLANPQWQKDRIRRALHDGNYLYHWTGNNYPAGKANHPVTNVPWYAAVAYANWAGKRLPTEAEWERAARGGLAGQKYPWGNGIDAGKANYGGIVEDTTPVGRYAANGYGLYDMAGNVWEWCLDAYDANFYFTSPKRNPLSDVNTVANMDLILNDFTNVKSFRVLRGGSWSFTARTVRCADRGYTTPAYTGSINGFRCARAVTP